VPLSCPVKQLQCSRAAVLCNAERIGPMLNALGMGVRGSYLNLQERNPDCRLLCTWGDALSESMERQSDDNSPLIVL
jgi:hypothetical protein